MSKLLVKPRRDSADGVVHHITPDSAGWTYVGFDVLSLAPGQTASRDTGGREVCLVLISGRGHVQAAGADFGVLGERSSPFEGSPWSVYVPPHATWRVTAEGAVELAVCSAPALGKFPARIIPPSEVGQETRGKGTNTRHVRNILPVGRDAESLLVVEVITPGGHWSSYPPHKHDTDDPPNETLLEETYYHRLARGAGFAIQRVYTDDLTLDETFAVGDGDVVLVPRGYHPVGAPHGFDLYYLNVMAGPVRDWKFSMAPDHQFLGW
jgi:5-deoxy-glucuronate isomerase